MQIGNAITEKMVLDVLLQARDRGLFRADHRLRRRRLQLGRRRDGRRARRRGRPGAGPAEVRGAVVHRDLDLRGPGADGPGRAAGAPRPSCVALCASGGRRGDRPRPVRRHRPADAPLPRRRSSATWRWTSSTRAGRRSRARRPSPRRPSGRPTLPERDDYTADLLALLRRLGRLQQGVDHPPVRPRGPGPDRGQAAGRRREDGPGDARWSCRSGARREGLAIGCGINPRYGDLDPYAMAGCVIDEAIRNCVAVGADPDRIALLDNFCWGNPERPETLGSLVLAAQGLPRPGAGLRHAVHLGQGQPVQRIHARRQEPGHPADPADQRDRPGARRPPLRDDGPEGAGQRPARRRPDARRAGRLDLARSAPAAAGGRVPQVDPDAGRATFRAVHAGDRRAAWSASCHDLSEGGLAVALAEMALAGGLGAEASLRDVPCPDDAAADAVLCCSPSRPSRFLLEVRPERRRRGARPVRRPADRPARAVACRRPTPRLTVRGLRRPDRDRCARGRPAGAMAASAR